MLFTVEDDLEIMRNMKLTTRQLMFVKMLVPDDSLPESEARRKIYRMALEFQDMCPLSGEELMDMVSREVIFDLNSVGSVVTYDSYEISPQYLHKFKLKVVGMPTQLFNTYPNFFQGGDVTYNAKDAGPEEIAPIYLRSIVKDEEEHRKILADVQWAKENRQIRTGIKKFVATRGWEGIRELRKKVQPKMNGNRLG